MAIDFNKLIQDVTKSSTIEGSFMVFLTELVDELGDIYTVSDNHDVRDLITELNEHRIHLATAMASNIVLSE